MTKSRRKEVFNDLFPRHMPAELRFQVDAVHQPWDNSWGVTDERTDIKGILVEHSAAARLVEFFKDRPRYITGATIHLGEDGLCKIDLVLR